MPTHLEILLPLAGERGAGRADLSLTRTGPMHRESPKELQRERSQHLILDLPSRCIYVSSPQTEC